MIARYIFMFMVFFCCLKNAVVYAQDKMIAVVNNEAITQRDMDSFMNFMRIQYSKEFSGEKLEKKIESMKSDMLQRLIEDRLILQDAKKEKLNMDESRIKGKISEIRRSFKSDREFQAYLVSQGMSEADLYEKMRDQMLIYTLIETNVKDKIVVKPAEITDFYNKNIKQFEVAEEREFLSLIMDSKDTAERAAVSLKEGKSVEDIVKDNSAKTSNFTARRDGELKKEIEDVVFGLGQNNVSDPVLIDNVYYIFKLVKVSPSRQKSLVEARNDISKALFEKKMSEGVVEMVEKLKKRALVKIM
jgi:parvulin-like peptidyl-prolyl isomerase